MSENVESTMSEKFVQRLPEVIKRKTSLGNMKIKIMVFMTIVIQTILIKMMKTNIILEKRASLILGHFLLMELIVSYKAHSMRCTTYNREKPRH